MSDVETLEMEVAALKAKLAQYEPEPAPKIEYPKWVRKRDEKGQVLEQMLVQSETEHEALGGGWDS